MLKQQYAENDRQLWQQVFTTEINYIEKRQQFLNNCTNRVALIRQAIHNPASRGTALRLVEYLKLEEIQLLFDDLLELASVSHSDIQLCREAILLLPKKWLVANIEKSAAPLLVEGTDEEYRRLLELYIEIDWDLTYKLATEALNHEDINIREAGEDFLSYLHSEGKS